VQGPAAAAAGRGKLRKRRGGGAAAGWELDLVVVGEAFGHAAEILQIIGRVNAARPTWRLLGCYTDGGAPLQPKGCPVLGTLAEAAAGLGPGGAHSRALVAVQNGRPPAHALPPARLATIVDPAAFVAATARLGWGCVLYPGCFVGHRARVANFVLCLPGAVINHDCSVGRGAVLGARATLAGSVRVRAGAYIGQAATVREGVCLGGGCLVGTGAVVLRDVGRLEVTRGLLSFSRPQTVSVPQGMYIR
jgi:carbonic anhydrase/acetyltransferase-like protein (isoleucine patch superfamily)